MNTLRIYFPENTNTYYDGQGNIWKAEADGGCDIPEDMVHQFNMSFVRSTIAKTGQAGIASKSSLTGTKKSAAEISIDRARTAEKAKEELERSNADPYSKPGMSSPLTGTPAGHEPVGTTMDASGHAHPADPKPAVVDPVSKSSETHSRINK
jgi:hypothetical protein